MRNSLSVFGLTALILIAIDLAVASFLSFAESRNQVPSIVRYFEYGRSVPGKLDRWIESPGTPGNLFGVAWRSDIIADSKSAFAAEDPAAGPVIRSYGMSFVNHILVAAQEVDPSLQIDSHGGPGAPPNFTYAVAFDDRAQRREGDVNVLGILSSSVPALAAMSNRTIFFEQPAPFTYPVFLPEAGGLRRIEPLVNSAQQELSLAADLKAAKAWHEQLSQQDAYYSSVEFGAPLLDRSPFLRLVRRSIAVARIQQKKRDLMDPDDTNAFPYREVIHEIVRSFAIMSREDGQLPLVMLIQSRDSSDVDVLSVAQPILEEFDIPYFATVEHFDPRDSSGFLPDGHYQKDVDGQFGRALLETLRKNGFGR